MEHKQDSNSNTTTTISKTTTSQCSSFRVTVRLTNSSKLKFSVKHYDDKDNTDKLTIDLRRKEKSKDLFVADSVCVQDVPNKPFENKFLPYNLGMVEIQSRYESKCVIAGGNYSTPFSNTIAECGFRIWDNYEDAGIEIHADKTATLIPNIVINKSKQIHQWHGFSSSFFHYSDGTQGIIMAGGTQIDENKNEDQNRILVLNLETKIGQSYVWQGPGAIGNRPKISWKPNIGIMISNKINFNQIINPYKENEDWQRLRVIHMAFRQHKPICRIALLETALKNHIWSFLTWIVYSGP